MPDTISCIHLPPLTLLTACLAYSLILKMEMLCFSETLEISSRLHSITSQNIALFIVTTMRTSDLKYERVYINIRLQVLVLAGE
jgi:N-acetylmuramic acid 6-phosphate (MurNAc-6-P) etherase